MNQSTDLSQRYQALLARIRAAEQRYDRKHGSVALLAVTKGWAAATVREEAALGQSDFGENYVQEAVTKIRATVDLPLRWHFIGRIQSNKVRAIASHFSWVHSLARAGLADQLARARPPGTPPLHVCIQVNVDNELSKDGVAPQNVATLAAHIAQLPQLRLRGIMAIPAAKENFEAQRDSFRKVHEVFATLHDVYPTVDTMSMGMSSDLEAAIAEGSTMVRVGTALFGARPI